MRQGATTRPGVPSRGQVGFTDAGIVPPLDVGRGGSCPAATSRGALPLPAPSRHVWGAVPPFPPVARPQSHRLPSRLTWAGPLRPRPWKPSPGTGRWWAPGPHAANLRVGPLSAPQLAQAPEGLWPTSKGPRRRRSSFLRARGFIRKSLLKGFPGSSPSRGLGGPGDGGTPPLGTAASGPQTRGGKAARPPCGESCRKTDPRTATGEVRADVKDPWRAGGKCSVRPGKGVSLLRVKAEANPPGNGTEARPGLRKHGSHEPSRRVEEQVRHS